MNRKLSATRRDANDARGKSANSSRTVPGRNLGTIGAPIAPTSFLYWTVFAYMVLTYIRPQDIVRVFGLVRPGIPVTALVLIASIPFIGSQLARSTIVRAGFAFLALIIIGGVVTVNQYWWYQTVWAHIITTIVFFICMPTLFDDKRYRNALLKLLIVAFDSLAIWALTHHGVGPGAFLGDENDAGVALGIGVCFATLVGGCFPGRTWRVFAVASTIVCAAAVVATGSRGGFLGLVAAVIGIAWFSRRTVRILAIAAVLAAVAYPLLPAGYVDQRLASANDPNDPTRAERLYGWHRGWEMYLDNPLIGVGAANFGWRVAQYDSTEKAIAERKDRRSLGGRAAHSLYFQLLPETGTIGAALYLFLLLSALRIGARVGRGETPGNIDEIDRGLARACAASLLSFSVSGAFVSVLFYPHFWMLTGLTGYIRSKELDLGEPTVAARVP
jgi:hypothetical protein